ncbi:MAG: ABC transporter, ATP-binding protein (cluster 1, maltose/g3p/polyamine/iron); ABC transporter, ATP-binding protein (cluster 10, nitrate/sulfonate/bicarbonate), partial [uncultured Rubellimicrobium sp.]
ARLQPVGLHPRAPPRLRLRLRPQGAQPRHPRGRVPGAPGLLGLRQVHAAELHRGPPGAHRRADLHQGQERHLARAQRPRHRHGLPELRALSADDRAREPELRPQERPRAPGRDRLAGRPRGQDPPDRAAPRPQAGPAVGRAAAAGRHRAGAGARRGRVPLRRAPVEPRRQAARRPAGGDQAPPPAARQHHDLRDPRSGGGHDPRRPDRGHAGRADHAARHPARDLQPAAEQVRGRLHRQPVDELPRRPVPGRRVPDRGRDDPDAGLPAGHPAGRGPSRHPGHPSRACRHRSPGGRRAAEGGGHCRPRGADGLGHAGLDPAWKRTVSCPNGRPGPRLSRGPVDHRARPRKVVAVRCEDRGAAV